MSITAEGRQHMAQLMVDNKVVGVVTVTATNDVEPIQIAATAHAAITAVKIGDETFSIDEINEWWA